MTDYLGTMDRATFLELIAPELAKIEHALKVNDFIRCHFFLH